MPCTPFKPLPACSPHVHDSIHTQRANPLAIPRPVCVLSHSTPLAPLLNNIYKEDPSHLPSIPRIDVSLYTLTH